MRLGKSLQHGLRRGAEIAPSATGWGAPSPTQHPEIDDILRVFCHVDRDVTRSAYVIPTTTQWCGLVFRQAPADDGPGLLGSHFAATRAAARRAAIRMAVASVHAVRGHHDAPATGIEAMLRGAMPAMAWQIEHRRPGVDPVRHAWKAIRSPRRLARILTDLGRPLSHEWEYHDPDPMRHFDSIVVRGDNGVDRPIVGRAAADWIRARAPAPTLAEVEAAAKKATLK